MAPTRDIAKQCGAKAAILVVAVLSCLIFSILPARAVESAAGPATFAETLKALAAAEGIEVKGLDKLHGPAPEVGGGDAMARIEALLKGVGHAALYGEDGRLSRIVILKAPKGRGLAYQVPRALPPRTDQPFAFAGRGLVGLAFGPEAVVRVSSRFGPRLHPIRGTAQFHKGIDLAAKRGTPVRAVAAGRIEQIGRRWDYGRYIRVRHDARHVTLYAHLGRVARGLRAGSEVEAGQTIGTMGSSGRTTGPHLHFEIQVDGKAVDPLRYRYRPGQIASR